MMFIASPHWKMQLEWNSQYVCSVSQLSMVCRNLKTCPILILNYLKKSLFCRISSQEREWSKRGSAKEKRHAAPPARYSPSGLRSALPSVYLPSQWKLWLRCRQFSSASDRSEAVFDLARILHHGPPGRDGGVQRLQRHRVQRPLPRGRPAPGLLPNCQGKAAFDRMMVLTSQQGQK